jgi:hypothetical protein
MRSRRRLLATLAAVAVATAACAAATRTTFPPPGSSPAPVGTAAGSTTREVIGALAAIGLPAIETSRAYRPPEGPLLAAAPRSIVQATLPNDPGHGFIVVYALGSDAAAQAAAEDHAAYVASGIGRVHFAPDARFVLRVVGSTVVFFWWSPGAALDERTRDIEAALLTLGVEVPILG